MKSKKKTSYSINKDLFLLLSTSGSTGSAKLVKLTRENITSNTKNIIEYLSLKEKDRTVTNLPFNYAYGLSVINTHLQSNAQLIISDKSVIDNSLIDLVNKNNISNFNGVPSTYDLLFNLRLENHYLRSTRFLSQAGGALKKITFDSISKYTKKQGKDFFIMYGQTEASPRMAYYLVEDKEYKEGIIGKPIKGGRLLIKDNKNKIIKEPNKIGRIFYYGPNIFSGYANNSKHLKNQRKRNYLNTGDIGKFDVEGNYYISGRSSRYIKIEDKRISLDELENLISEKNKDVVCTFKEKKIIVWYTDYNLDLKKTYMKIKENTSVGKRNFIFRFIEEFPKNSSGKVLFKELKL